MEPQVESQYEWLFDTMLWSAGIVFVLVLFLSALKYTDRTSSNTHNDKK